jgi:hypothetical protein
MPLTADYIQSALGTAPTDPTTADPTLVDPATMDPALLQTDPTGDLATLESNVNTVQSGAGGASLPPSYLYTAATSNLPQTSLSSVGSNFASYVASSIGAPVPSPTLPEHQVLGDTTPISQDHAASGSITTTLNNVASGAPAPGQSKSLLAKIFGLPGIKQGVGLLAKTEQTRIGQDITGLLNKLMIGKHLLDRATRYSETQTSLGGIATKPGLAPAEAAWMKGQNTGSKATFGQIVAEELTGQHRGVDSTGQMNPGSTPFHLISGTVDAVAAMATDPLSILGDIAKGLQVAKRAPESADAVDGLISNARTVTAAKVLAKVDDAGKIKRLSRAYGWGLSDATIQDVAKASTTDDVLQALKSHALFEGQASMRMMPMFYQNAALRQVSRIHEWQMPSFSTASNPASKFASVLSAPVRAVSRIVPSDVIHLLSPDASSAFSDVVDTWLPNASQAVKDARVGEFINASMGAKGDVVEKTINEGMRNMGYSDEEIASMAEQGLKVGDPKVFGPAGEDKPQLVSQLENTVRLPDYRTYLDLKAQKMEGIVGRIARGGLKADDIAYGFTRRVNPLWLAHPAWMFKVGMDETLATLARTGIAPMDWAKEVAASFIKDWTAHPDGVRKAVGEAWQSTWDHVTNLPGLAGLSPPTTLPEGVQIPEHMTMGAHGSHMNGWLNVTGAPTSEAVKAERQAAADEAAQLITKSTGRAPRMVPGGWKVVDQSEQPVNYGISYSQIVNHQLRNDEVANAFIHHATTQDALADLEGTYFARDPATGDRYVTKAGKERLTDLALAPKKRDPASWVKAMEGHISKTGQLVNDMLPGSMRHLAATGPIGFDDIKAAQEAGQLPQKVWGFNFKIAPKEAKGLGGAYQQVVDNVFGPMGHFLDNSVRKPLWNSLYRQEFDRLSSIADSAGFPLDSELASKSAATYATDRLMGTIHNPAQKTAFDIYTRSFMPFNFAKIQSIKRWGRVLEENPSFVRTMHLFNDSFSQDGVFHKDSFGNSVFSVPVPNEFLQAFLTFKVGAADESPAALGPLNMFTKAIAPPMMPFDGNVMPGFGAALTLPVAAIVSRRPSVNAVRQAILGPGFSQTSYPGMSAANRAIQAVAPTWMSNLSRAVHADPADRSYANAFKDAMSWAIFNGKNPEDPKTKAAIMAQAREMYLVRAASSLFSPYSQTPDFEGMAPVKELRQLQADHGNTVGSHLFLQKYGDKGVGYTLGKTAAVSKDLFPTPAAEKFYEDNQDLFAAYPNTAGYFAPQDTFDPKVIAQQVANGERKTLTPDEWIAKIMIPAGNAMYYDKVKPLIDVLRAQKRPSNVVSAIEAQKLKEIDTLHPGWLAYHNQGSSRAAQRTADITELQRAAADPRLANNQAAADTRTFSALYNSLLAVAAARGNKSLSATANRPLLAILVAKGKEMVAADPDFQAQWTYLWEPELGISDAAVAGTPESLTGQPVAGVA